MVLGAVTRPSNSDAAPELPADVLVSGRAEATNVDRSIECR